MRITPSRSATLAVACLLVVAVAGGACEFEDEPYRDTGLAIGFDQMPGATIDLLDDMVPLELADHPVPTVIAAGEPHVFYMNFSDGETEIFKGPDNSRTNTSQICASKPYPVWTGASGCGDRDQCIRTIANIVQDQWQDFNIVLTTKRPSADVPYSMEMIGPMSGKAGSCNFPPGVGGIAPFDCGNRVETNICYAFLCNDSPRACAVIISQEEAHTFGLAHTTDACDIMYPTVSKCGEAKFPDKPNGVTGMGCSGSTQNSYQMLKSALGEWPTGMQHPRDWEDCFAGPPGVEITSPADGERTDGTFTVKGRIIADCPVRTVKIEVLGNGMKLEAEDRDASFEKKVENLTEGDYLVRVSVVQGDTMEQTGEGAIAVHVDASKPCKADIDCDPDRCIEGRCTVPLPAARGCAVPRSGGAGAGLGAALLGLWLVLRRRR